MNLEGAPSLRGFRKGGWKGGWPILSLRDDPGVAPPFRPVEPAPSEVEGAEGGGFPPIRVHPRRTAALARVAERFGPFPRTSGLNPSLRENT